MGDILSTPSTNPSESPRSTSMPSSETSQTPDSKPEETKTLDAQTPVVQQSPDPPPPTVKENQTLEDNQSLEDQEQQHNVEEGDVEGEEEEEGECGFCLFMKGGGCKDSFIAWEKCIEEAEKNKEDIVDKCFEVTGMLKKCMEAHPDYYGPILQAEKAVEEEAMRELEKEKAKEAADTSVSKGSEQNSAEEDSQERVSEGS